MSLVLFLFYWVGIPLLIILVARSLWHRSRVPFHKGLVVAASAMVFLGLLWLAEGRKWLLDQQVREMCAKDGGVKVYETVPLTSDLLDKAGRIWIPDKAQAKPSDEYYYESDVHYYRKGNPEMSRSQHRIIRRSDGKVLGELIRYGRGGGDLPGPWHGSSFMCPDPTKASNFESSVFVKGDEK